ncbi:MAG: polysaccharide biosynthesis protein [Nitrospinota bacterium]|nr:polysaccharide biosynthesis protein [Nitrospinota bacterium]
MKSIKSWFPLGNANWYLVLAVDSAIFALSYYLAYRLRFESQMEFDSHFQTRFLPTVFWIMGMKIAIFGYFGLHRGMWRYTSLADLLNILKASLASFVFCMLFMSMYLFPVTEFSRSVFVMDMVITAGLVSMFRIAIRLSFSSRRGIAGKLSSLLPGAAGKADEGIPVAVYRADERGEMLLRSLLSDAKSHHLRPVGLVDDDPRHNGAYLHGLPVLGPPDSLPEIAERFGIMELLVASRVDAAQFENISRLCRELNIHMRVAPAFLDERRNRIDVGTLRDARIEDLLSRDPVSVDYSTVESTFQGKKILITGAGGSIGAQLAVQIAEFSPAALILVDKSENYMHQLEVDLCARFPKLDIVYRILNITQGARLEKIFKTHRPDFVFHAAAHKHVPLMERDKEEVVLNNVGGMKTVADLAASYGVKRFILISTDKAVNPSNAMGVTKRICELYMLHKNRVSDTDFLAVRFGNVLGSNGSVAPIFMKQIESRGPVTVTHPDMERFFMTIPEAVLLILQAVTIGAGGELYILSMGEQVKIRDLAEKMIRLAGFVPGKDIEIIYTGLRPGEKLSEELAGEGETVLDTSHAKIKKLKVDGVTWAGVDQEVDKWLTECEQEPEITYRHMAEWVKNPAAPTEGDKITEPPRQKVEHGASRPA